MTKIIVRKDNKKFNGLSPVYRYGKIKYTIENWQKEIILTEKNVDKSILKHDVIKKNIHWDDKKKKLKYGVYPLTQAEKDVINKQKGIENIKNNLAELLYDLKTNDDFSKLKIEIDKLKVDNE